MQHGYSQTDGIAESQQSNCRLCTEKIRQTVSKLQFALFQNHRQNLENTFSYFCHRVRPLMNFEMALLMASPIFWGQVKTWAGPRKFAGKAWMENLHQAVPHSPPHFHSCRYSITYKSYCQGFENSDRLQPWNRAVLFTSSRSNAHKSRRGLIYFF